MKTDSEFMQRALALASHAASVGEVPVGAVVVCDGEVIGEGFNQPITSQDPTAHAEIVALRAAAANLSNYRLPDCTLYVTVEPCTMCWGAMIHARVARLIYGASEPKAGAVGGALKLHTAPCYNHRIDITAGVLAEESADLMRRFFALRRAQ